MENLVVYRRGRGGGRATRTGEFGVDFCVGGGPSSVARRRFDAVCWQGARDERLFKRGNSVFAAGIPERPVRRTDIDRRLDLRANLRGAVTNPTAFKRKILSIG